MSLNGQEMEINGLKLNVLVEGEGEPVMLLHGFPDSNYVWRDVVPLLVNAGYKVIVPDQRGFGESDAPEGKEKNWIPTVPNQGFFAYLRLYAPLEAYFDRSWKMPDVELVK